MTSCQMLHKTPLVGVLAAEAAGAATASAEAFHIIFICIHCRDSCEVKTCEMRDASRLLGMSALAQLSRG